MYGILTVCTDLKNLNACDMFTIVTVIQQKVLLDTNLCTGFSFFTSKHKKNVNILEKKKKKSFPGASHKFINSRREKKKSKEKKKKQRNLTFLFSVLENKHEERNYTPVFVHKLLLLDNEISHSNLSIIVTLVEMCFP